MLLPDLVILVFGLASVAAAIVAVVRGVDVRLALLLAALALGFLAGKPMVIVQTFLATLADEKFVVPICCAMGFAYVLRHTQCDRHLVHLLVDPLRRVRALLIPGTVLVGFLVNIPVISQTSTAVTIGAVLIPLLLAARISPITVGAALLLGSSIGGELLNPGAPELRTTAEETRKAVAAAPRASAALDGAGRVGRVLHRSGVLPASGQAPLAHPPSKGADLARVSAAVSQTGAECAARVFPLLLAQLAVATALFWFWSARYEARYWTTPGANGQTALQTEPHFQVNLIKALVPLVPLILLFGTARPFELIAVPKGWLVKDPESQADLLRFDSRLIGAAMLVGVAVAALVARRTALGVARAFFEGTGYAFTNIISLIVTATCLGEGVKLIGLADLIGRLVTDWPSLLMPVAGLLPWGFAVLCGSGMAATQSLFRFFAQPALSMHIDPAHAGAVVSIAAAAGRTMSPVAAVTLMCATLTGTNPVHLIKRVAVPLFIGVLVVIILAAIMASCTDLVYTG
jgi:DcuC family C4-dicarboxylate transporter